MNSIESLASQIPLASDANTTSSVTLQREAFSLFAVGLPSEGSPSIQANYGSDVSNIFDLRDGEFATGQLNENSTASATLGGDFRNSSRLYSIVYLGNSSLFQDTSRNATPGGIIFSVSLSGNVSVDLTFRANQVLVLVMMFVVIIDLVAIILK